MPLSKRKKNRLDLPRVLSLTLIGKLNLYEKSYLDDLDLVIIKREDFQSHNHTFR